MVVRIVPPLPLEVAAPSYIGEQVVRGWVSGGGGGRGCRPPVLTEGRPVRIGIGPEEKKKEERYRSRWIFRLDNKNQMSKGSRPIGLPSCSEVDECCLARLAQRVVDSQKIQVGHG